MRERLGRYEDVSSTSLAAGGAPRVAVHARDATSMHARRARPEGASLDDRWEKP